MKNFINVAKLHSQIITQNKLSDNMKQLISILIIPFFLSISPLDGQDVYMEDFSVPICENGNGEDTLHFFEAYNGAYNDCGYKVIFATLFTSW